VEVMFWSLDPREGGWNGL